MGEAIITPDRDIVKAFNEFAIELFMNSVDEVKGNLVISPITIQSALTMALIGAGRGNETQSQMLNSLKYFRKFSLDRIASECRDAMEDVKVAKGVKLATKFYIAENLEPFKPFMKYAKKHCKFEPEKINFSNPKSAAQKINNFALKKTNKKLGKLITKEELTENTKMVIANAIHFRRIWDEEFDKRESFKSPFFVNDNYTIYMHYMCSRTSMKYAQVPLYDIKLLELPFKKSDLAMTFILPNKANGLKVLQKTLNQMNIMETVKHLKPLTVTAEIPVFRIESNVNMISPLRKMGITRAFTETAQFDQMYFDYKEIQLNNVVHKACIEINEEGNNMSLSAGFASFMKYSGVQMTDHFSCYHPFMFIVRCTRKNMIYFIGRVNFEREDNDYIPKTVYMQEEEIAEKSDGGKLKGEEKTEGSVNQENVDDNKENEASDSEHETDEENSQRDLNEMEADSKNESANENNISEPKSSDENSENPKI